MITPRINTFISLGSAIFFAGTAAYLFYQLFKKDDDDEDLIDTKNTATESLAKLEIKIPRQSVGAVIGRQGSNVKLIQELTSTSIRFRDDSENSRTCIIMGKIEKAERAKELILKSVSDVPFVDTKEIFVPKSAVGRIIGRQGITVEAISRSSGAKVRVDKDNKDKSFSDESEPDMHRIVIQGTPEQINAAEAACMEKVQEERRMQKDINTSASKMSQRSKVRSDANCNSTEESSRELNPAPKVDIPSGSDKFIQVYISSVKTPAHFWVQVVSRHTVEIDKLVDEMTQYYSNEPNKELQHLEAAPKVSDIVAAKFSTDQSWYRGRIVSVNPDGNKFEVFFVDFGDTEIVDLEDICELRTDYLKLSFQAMECYLDGIDPESVKTQQSLDTFESLAYAMEWKPVMLKINSYKVIDEGTVPCVILIDTSSATDVNIAEELVKRKLARRNI